MPAVNLYFREPYRRQWQEWQRRQRAPSLQPLSLLANLQASAQAKGWPMDPTLGQLVSAASACTGLCTSPHRWQRGQRGPREQFSKAHGFAQEVGCPTVPTEITAFAFVAGLCAA
mmetsp:Transcript_92986/g.262170  ORF Transcript_92986/g.262170 Transcript_92986/m.262170 type:complete len:115 (+) Transcript_92986:99-443(+)